MNASERRKELEKILKKSKDPVTASVLAKEYGVSRQIIVGDIALLRAGGLNVLATPRGYVLESALAYVKRNVVCRHGADRIYEEFCIVVDLGGAMLDVTVEHPVYGEICVPLHIFSRFDADAFCRKLSRPDARPLCDLTSGIHLHTVRASDEAALDRVVKGLSDNGFLFTSRDSL